MFLGIPLTDDTPDHSSLTWISQWLPPAVNEQVFEFVLRIAAEKKLLNGATVAVDSTTLEANAAMRAIVRRDNGDDWKSYLKQLAKAEGVEIKNDDDLRRFDQERRRQGKKKVTNAEWESKADPDARICRMKDGRTHPTYKAEHVVDLDSEFIIQAEVHHGDAADTQTVIGNLVEAQVKLDRCFEGIQSDDPTCGVIQEAVTDKGYHSNEGLKSCTDPGIRSYIPERQGGERVWTDKDEPTRAAFHGNRQRMKRSKGKNLQKSRSELVERGFAHVCETGGARKTWLRGLEKVRERHLTSVAAHKLGLVMRCLFGFGKPRAFSAASGVATLYYPAISALTSLSGRRRACCRFLYFHFLELVSDPNVRPVLSANVAFSTGC